MKKTKMRFRKHKNSNVSKKLKRFLFKNNLVHIYNALHFRKDGKNYFDFSITDKTKISYLRGNRIPDVSESHLIYNNTYRKTKGYHSKIGKIISDIEGITNYDVQKVSSLLKANAHDFKIIASSEICKYYHEENYTENHATSGGRLFNSCMRDDSENHLMKFYEDIGKNDVELLVLLDEDDLVMGRSLLWHHCDINFRIKDNDKRINLKDVDFMDRVYSTNDNVDEYFRKEGNTRNIVYRIDSNYFFNGNEIDLLYIDKNLPSNIDTSLDAPYLDSLQYYNSEENLLSNHTGDCLDWNHSIDSITEKMVCCDVCNDRFNSDNEGCYDDINDGYLCDAHKVYLQYKRLYTNIENCTYIDSDDSWYLNEDVVYINDEAYFEEDENIIYSDFIGEYVLLEDTVETKDDKIIMFEDSVEIDSEYFHIDDTVETKDGNLIYDRDSIETFDGDIIHKDDSIETFFKKLIIHVDDSVKTKDGNLIHVDDSIELDGEIHFKDDTFQDSKSTQLCSIDLLK